ncbi:hypothetical protein [Myroides indicus]|uniref:Uncharacterized protein n=1 Tax=Myroides indicus TaxID=1323422 RepID=A0A4R7EXG1_9FLAO|nr:hypothetical protein [Myroides indicus]TDS58202.1 hypothetical protein C8P70_11233 [Myroides indicus]
MLNKFFKSVLCLIAIVLVSFSGNAQNGRQTAAADAAGALGGAGSAAGIINFLSLTPPGWLVLGGGALIGGVAGSLAVYESQPLIEKAPEYLANSLNTMDYVGAKHNEILVDYLKVNKSYTPDVFLEFSKKYDTNNKSVDIKFLSTQYSEMKNLKNYEDVVQYTLKQLPKDVDKKEFADFLRRIGKLEDLKVFISEVKRFENTLISNQSFSDGAIGQLSVYFSTLRYSAFLWNKK